MEGKEDWPRLGLGYVGGPWGFTEQIHPGQDERQTQHCFMSQAGLWKASGWGDGEGPSFGNLLEGDLPSCPIHPGK